MDLLLFENGHKLLLRYCIRVIHQKLDIPVAEFLCSVYCAEEETRLSQAEELLVLVSEEDTALRKVRYPLEELALPKALM
jgi:hypothetical protein